MPAKRKAVGSWPHFTQPFGFYAIARESVFLSYREKQQHQHFFMLYRNEQTTMIMQFFHRIAQRASDDTQRCIFYVVSR
jgi:hypothetical protein